MTKIQGQGLFLRISIEVKVKVSIYVSRFCYIVQIYDKCLWLKFHDMVAD
jgi:hypothetical protein